MKWFQMVTLSLTLIGCSSAPLNLHYYSLHLPKQTGINTGTKQHTELLLKPIQIADYLKHSSLVMQIEKHQLYYSPQHLWAEPLGVSFRKALKQELNESPRLLIVDTQFPNTTSASLQFVLEHFHATNHAKVLAAGHYRVLNLDTSENLINIHKPFYFELALKADGHGHAVQQLRQLIQLIANKIRQDIITEEQTGS